MVRKLRMGMVGGGIDAFIGAVHRYAAHADGYIDLVCGALSSDSDKARKSGQRLFLKESRIYSSYREMIEKESALPPEVRMDFVAIVTPNHLHFEPAMLALDKGFDVFIEKPMTFSLEEAISLREKVKETGQILALAHAYTGYPMIREARHLIASGVLGRIRKIFVNYHQGWLSRLSEKEGNKQASWRTDPARSGQCGAMGDIGVHAFNLAEFVSGCNVNKICAVLNTVVPGRALDDDGAVLLEFDQGASGVLTATQVAAGEENALSLKVFGEDGGLEWHQMEPNTLIHRPLEGPAKIYRSGMGYVSADSMAHTRVPPGHPEGYLEAFANLYKTFAMAIDARNAGLDINPFLVFPSIDQGVRGMAFIDTVVRSHHANTKWTEFINP
jgi:predicted dehydrogenase